MSQISFTSWFSTRIRSNVTIQVGSKSLPQVEEFSHINERWTDVVGDGLSYLGCIYSVGELHLSGEEGAEPKAKLSIYCDICSKTSSVVVKCVL